MSSRLTVYNHKKICFLPWWNCKCPYTKSNQGLLGAFSYCLMFVDKMATATRPIVAFLTNHIDFDFAPKIEVIVGGPLQTTRLPTLCVSPNSDAVHDGCDPFRAYCEARTDGFGAKLEQVQ